MSQSTPNGSHINYIQGQLESLGIVEVPRLSGIVSIMVFLGGGALGYVCFYQVCGL